MSLTVAQRVAIFAGHVCTIALVRYASSQYAELTGSVRGSVPYVGEFDVQTWVLAYASVVCALRTDAATHVAVRVGRTLLSGLMLAIGVAIFAATLYVVNVGVDAGIDFFGVVIPGMDESREEYCHMLLKAWPVNVVLDAAWTPMCVQSPYVGGFSTYAWVPCAAMWVYFFQ